MVDITHGPLGYQTRPKTNKIGKNTIYLSPKAKDELMQLWMTYAYS